MNTENNKLMAEFMEYKVINDELFDNKNLFIQHSNETLKFHSDWNWLMEVVDKIIKTKNIYAQEKQKVFNLINPNINITYNACIQFIQWYNQNKTSN